jgi:Tat protein secretion system quality control protein TatD with DNase activity
MILKEAGWDSSWPGGVVHSFTGTIEEAKELVG